MNTNYVSLVTIDTCEILRIWISNSSIYQKGKSDILNNLLPNLRKEMNFFASHKSYSIQWIVTIIRLTHILFFLSGFEKAQRLLLIGGGCLLIVFIFGVILCRLDISAGKSKQQKKNIFYFIFRFPYRTTSTEFSSSRNLNSTNLSK